jgi:hypothetical protein
MVRRKLAVLVSATILLSAAAIAVGASPADEALIPLESYSTDKAKALATRYRPQLVEMHDEIYHCLPWLQIQPAGIGFRKPKGAPADDRFLSVWLLIHQHDEGSFGAGSQASRASAMFSRYGVDLLRRMAGLSEPLRDQNVRGFSVVLTWPKPSPNAKSGPAVNETLALFVDKQTALGFLGRTVPAAQFVERARFQLFDGKEQVGRPALEVWEDSFLSTFKVANYEPPKGRKC